jgi:hypothetical protein
MSKRSVEDALTLAYLQQEEGNTLKPSLVVLACELLRLRGRECVLVKALKAIDLEECRLLAESSGCDIEEYTLGFAGSGTVSGIARAALGSVKE